MRFRAGFRGFVVNLVCGVECEGGIGMGRSGIGGVGVLELSKIGFLGAEILRVGSEGFV